MSALIRHHPVRPEEAVADQELAALVQALSDHGILRFATAFVRALPHTSLIVARGLNAEASRTVIQNVVALLAAMGRVPPDDFAHFLEAVSRATRDVEQEAANGGGPNGEPPGLRGAYHLLQDDALWHALGPLLDGLKAFGDALGHRARPQAPEQPPGPLL